MTDGPIYELPSAIELPRDDYRLINAALEAALDFLDRATDVDGEPGTRDVVERALAVLARRIWPELGELDEED